MGEEEVGGRIRVAVTAWKLKKEWIGVLDKGRLRRCLFYCESWRVSVF